MRVAVLGAGRIGCGFLVPVLREAGHQVVLFGRDQPVLANFRRHGGWVVHRVGRAGAVTRRMVDCPDVRCATGPTAVADLSVCEVALVAVGGGDLSGVVPLLTAALQPGCRLRDVVVVENQVDPAASLAEALGPARSRCGVSSGLVTSVVSGRDGDPRWGRLTFVGDDTGRLAVDARTLRGALPEAPEIQAVSAHADAVRRKLYTFNAGHAVAAYLGALKGYHYVHSAACDPQVARTVRGAMHEAQRGLAATSGAVGCEPVDDHLERFRRPLDDDVLRVGREPLRKLGREDRLVAPALLALAAGATPRHLATACAAALLSAQRSGELASAGQPSAPGRLTDVPRIVAAFCEVSDLPSDHTLCGPVAAALRALLDPSLPAGTLPVSARGAA